jgi:hypothetical protein
MSGTVLAIRLLFGSRARELRIDRGFGKIPASILFYVYKCHTWPIHSISYADFFDTVAAHFVSHCFEEVWKKHSGNTSANAQLDFVQFRWGNKA